ncbi:hypothetical protein NAU58_18135 [Pseudomonas stutzeri]|uniref:hypothetical protein n=1 Tax=Stutzerimonas stutzeri TaxID=316 RepID=UPI0011AF8F15|nr:hypothetical protein [Stutzerimonas stutzeri]MCQ4297501.1 hypothetical protein [Stutzerimonas stutzeri]
MAINQILEYMPTARELLAPAVVAAIYWLIKKGISFISNRSSSFLRAIRAKELKKAKAIRNDGYAVQRQIGKETAWFAAFIMSAVLSLGLLSLIAGTDKPFALKLFYYVVYVLPVLVVELAWLIQNNFVSVLLEEAARIPTRLHRAPEPRIQSTKRIKDREKRRQLIREIKMKRSQGQ